MKKEYSPPKLIVVPAKILQRITEARLPIHYVSTVGKLRDICNADDLVFYNYVNQHKSTFLSKQLLDAFSDVDFEIDVEEKLNQKRVMDMFPNKLDKFRALVTNDYLDSKLDDDVINHDNYVGHFFEIDRETIGVVFMVSTTPSIDAFKSLQSLIALLANNYMGSVDGVADISNDNHIQHLVNSGVLPLYLNSLTDKDKNS